MGYASEGNFTAFFKRIVGVSPKVFRNRSHLAPGASQDP
jgi:AraC-like DNA-binding protein